MYGGVRPPKSRQAVLPKSFARDLYSPPGAGQIWDDGFNRSVAQSAVRARRRNWVEGRIAECPRLQQIGRAT
jgi:hypothetical protein